MPKEGSKRGNPSLLTEDDLVKPLAAPAPDDDAEAIDSLLSDLKGELPSGAEMREMLRFHLSENPGEFTAGDPSRANYGTSDDARRAADVLDEHFNQEVLKQGNPETIKAARELLDKDHTPSHPGSDARPGRVRRAGSGSKFLAITLWRKKPFEALASIEPIVGFAPRDVRQAWRAEPPRTATSHALRFIERPVTLPPYPLPPRLRCAPGAGAARGERKQIPSNQARLLKSQ